MSTVIAPHDTTDERPPAPAADPTAPGRRRWPWLLVVVVVLLIVAGVVANSRHRAATPAAAKPPQATPVTRRDLTLDQNFDGTISTTPTTPALARGTGIVTAIAPESSTVTNGGILFRVGDQPTFAMAGALPAYRDLGPAASPGDDVKQLQEDLKALGADPDGAVSANGTFDAATAAAVVRWQESQGLAPTGTVALGTVVFVPIPSVVGSHQAQIGDRVAPGAVVTQLNVPTLAVTFTVPANPTGQIQIGEAVQATLPDYSTAPAVITTIGTGTDSSGNTVLNGTATLTDNAKHSFPDQAPAKIRATQVVVTKALTVTAQALVSRADGTWVVQLAGAGGTSTQHVVTIRAAANGTVALADDPALDNAKVLVPSAG